MKKIILVVLAVLVVAAIAVTVIPLTVGAVNSETEAVTNETTEISLEPDEVEEIVDVLKSSATKEDAIIIVAEKLGISKGEAEILIDAVLRIGDDYFGETDWWQSFKRSVEDDMQSWTNLIVIAVAVGAVATGAVILLSKTNPNIKKIKYGVAETVKISKENAYANSQTLGNIEVLVRNTVANDEIFRTQLDEKEAQIYKLLEKLTELEKSNERERRDMLMAETYNLRMLKLICDRTTLPLADKATIDSFYQKGLESIKAELAAEDIEKISEVIGVLDKD